MKTENEEALKEQLEMQKKVQELEEVVKGYLSKEAIMRFGNLKSAHQDIALKAIAFIGQAIQSGQINKKISDTEFKKILRKIQELK